MSMDIFGLSQMRIFDEKCSNALNICHSVISRPDNMLNAAQLTKSIENGLLCSYLFAYALDLIVQSAGLLIKAMEVQA
jgi:hypothetical protein